MSNSDLSTYLTSIGRYPILTKELQLFHARRIRAWVNYEGGKEAAPKRVRSCGERSMEVMVATNLRLVVSIAKKYQNRGVDLMDLIQEGNLGLIRGLELFDPSRGYQLSTYAYWWVRQAISRTIHTKSKLIRIPINMQELLGKIDKYVNETLSNNGEIPSHIEIAKALNVSKKRLDSVIDHSLMTSVFSLDSSALGAGRDSPRALIEQIADANQLDIEEVIERKTQDELIESSMETLSSLEARVVRGLYMQNQSYRELSKELGLSGSRIGQIKVKALNKLRLRLPRVNLLNT
tara:strand:- start:64 stop:939 length:876 start_codon:yes stop_codon:yes gene_type:complete